MAFEVAKALQLPLDVMLVRKLGAPGQEELAIGAIASGGHRVLNQHLIETLGVGSEDVERIVEQERAELERRERSYRGKGQPVEVEGRVAILVDDGLATGASMKVAVETLRTRGPKKIVVAVPTGAEDSCMDLAQLADQVVCCMTPRPFVAVGEWYENFSQTTDEEVKQLLDEAAGWNRKNVPP